MISASHLVVVAKDQLMSVLEVPQVPYQNRDLSRRKRPKDAIDAPWSSCNTALLSHTGRRLMHLTSELTT
jgi:hypothetical protein